ncbi:hypothetical protein FRB94_003650 [Tulasnella sp. JGI-2019a]|nr:hypothetical protein FRB93_005262 [Tulasnella sp. JGI-2019a]KAG9002730.1 hypothetical protein FRB94_003650 [Tulasnella sp. JGI-2019a]
MATKDAQPDGPHALNLPEIQLQIFESLAAKDLLNAALVCKTWSWPAIDTAWRTSKFRLSWILAPLVNCTAVQLQECEDPNRLPQIVDAEVVSAERWNSRLQWARRITRLVVDVSWKVTLAIIQLTDPLGEPICPNLLFLGFNIDGHDSLNEEADVDRWTPLLPLLIGPRLRILTLTFYGATERVLNDNIQSLASIAPQIQHVFAENYTDTASPDYSAFRQMRTLRVRGSMNHHTWKCLASCPRLKRIVIWEGDSGGEVDTQLYSITFPRVRALAIQTSGDPEFALGLLRGVTMPALQSLKIRFPISNAAAAAAKSEILEFMRHSQLLKVAMINGRVTRSTTASCSSEIVGSSLERGLQSAHVEMKPRG